MGSVHAFDRAERGIFMRSVAPYALDRPKTCRELLSDRSARRVRLGHAYVVRTIAAAKAEEHRPTHKPKARLSHNIAVFGRLVSRI